MHFLYLYTGALQALVRKLVRKLVRNGAIGTILFPMYVFDILFDLCLPVQ